MTNEHEGALPPTQDFLFAGVPYTYLGLPSPTELAKLKRISGLPLTSISQASVRGYPQGQLDALLVYTQENPDWGVKKPKQSKNSQAESAMPSLLPINMVIFESVGLEPPEVVPFEAVTRRRSRNVESDHAQGMAERKDLRQERQQRAQERSENRAQRDFSRDEVKRAREERRAEREAQVGLTQQQRIEARVEREELKEAERLRKAAEREEARELRANKTKKVTEPRAPRRTEPDNIKNKTPRIRQLAPNKASYVHVEQPREEVAQTRLDVLLEGADRVVTNLEMHFAEMGNLKYPDFAEQRKLASHIQTAKLVLFALNSFDISALPQAYQDRVHILLSKPKSQFFLKYFATTPKEGEKTEKEGKEEDSLKPLVSLGKKMGTNMERRIQDILDIEIPEDRDEELDKYLKDIEAKIVHGEKSHEELVVRNFKLVALVANRYKRSGRELEDLVEEGYIGLMIAASYYDFRRGFRFPTYAMSWIRSMISRAANNTSLIFTPDAVLRSLYKAEKEGSPINPTLEAARRARGLASLDKPVSDEHNSATFGESIPNPNSDAHIRHSELSDAREQILSKLHGQELFVLTERYGLMDGRQKTLEEVGDMMGLTRERVRQIEAKALTQLRQDKSIAPLHELL